MDKVSGYTRNEKRRLSQYLCAWCDQPLDRESCGAIYQKCTPEVRASRRASCLAGYRPRAASQQAEAGR